MVSLEIGRTKEDAFIGGMVNSVVRLCQGLSRNGNEVTIVTTPPRQQPYSENIKADWADIYAIAIKRSYFSSTYGIEFAIKALRKIRKLHKQKNFQIIVGHSGYPIISLIPGIAGKLLRVPSIHTLYCPLQRKDSVLSVNELLSIPKLSKVFLSQVDIIISLTENVKNSLIRTGVAPKKTRVIPPPVDHDIFNPLVSGKQFRARWGIDESDPLVLFVGNLTRQKGTHVALEAMREVIKCYPKARLVMTSELPTKHDDLLQQEVELSIKHLSLHNNIIRLGIIKDMAEIMAACDMLIAPFLSIAGISDYPLPVLEAMAVGRPVIATKIGGVPEVVMNMENGILIEPGDPSSLSKAIISLCKDHGLRQRLGENASSLISNNFLIDKIAKLTEMVYEEVAAYQ